VSAAALRFGHLFKVGGAQALSVYGSSALQGVEKRLSPISQRTCGRSWRLLEVCDWNSGEKGLAA